MTNAQIELIETEIKSLQEKIKKEQGFPKVQAEYTLKENKILLKKLKDKYHIKEE